LGRLAPGDLGRKAGADIRSGRYDVVHLHGLWSVDLLAAAGACLDCQVPLVWQPHGMLVRPALRKKRLKKLAFLRLLAPRLRCADAVIFATCGERTGSWTPRALPRDRLHVVPLPVTGPGPCYDRTELRAQGRARFEVPGEAPVVLSLGRLHPVKRPQLTLSAFASVRARVPDAVLLLAGDGDARFVSRLRSAVQQSGFSGHVRFPGWIRDQDKWLALAAADVLVQNSEFENFGYSIAEALMAETPVVLTENLAIAEEVVEAGGGVACPPDPDSLGAAVTAMLTRADRDRVGRAGRRWAEGSMTPDAVGGRLLELYHACRRHPRAEPATAAQRTDHPA
jgi:glycosyltransferase involved in cell wall biosynthesis